jgi:hypothetical protein
MGIKVKLVIETRIRFLIQYLPLANMLNWSQLEKLAYSIKDKKGSFGSCVLHKG